MKYRTAKPAAAVAPILEEPTDLDESAFESVPDDEFAGIADASEILQGTPPDVDGCDPVEPDTETLVERAKLAEGAALAVDGVTNSEGAEADYSRWEIHLAASNGFSGCYQGSRHSVAVSVLAGEVKYQEVCDEQVGMYCLRLGV